MNIHQSIIAIMNDVEAIKKDRENKTQGFRFRGIDDVYNAVHPLFAKHGVYSTPIVMDDRTEERVTKSGSNMIYRVLRIKYTFYTTDGSSVDAIVNGEGMDSGDKSSYKAMAGAHKYAILQVLMIPTEDMEDPDKDDENTKQNDAIKSLKDKKMTDEDYRNYAWDMLRECPMKTEVKDKWLAAFPKLDMNGVYNLVGMITGAKK